MEGGGSTGVLDYINLLKRNRHYRLLCLSEVVNLIGYWLTFVATMEVGKRMTGGVGMMVAIVLVMQRLPSVLFFPLAGVLADVADRGALLLHSHRLSALVVLLFPVIEHTGNIRYWKYAVHGFACPARDSIAQSIVDTGDIHLQATIDSILWGVMGAIGASLGGFAASALGTTPCFCLDSVTYILGSFICTGLVGIPRKAPKTVSEVSNAGMLESVTADLNIVHHEAPPVFNPVSLKLDMAPKGSSYSWLDWVVQIWLGFYDDFRKGLHFILAEKNRHIAGVLMVKGCGCMCFGVADVLYFKLAEMRAVQVLHSSSATLGLLFAFSSIGCVFGPLVSNQVTAPTPKGLLQWISLSFFFMAMSYSLMVFSIALPMLLITTFIRSSGAEILWAYSTTLLELEVDSGMMGRVSSMERLLSNSLELFSNLLTGVSQDMLHMPLAQLLSVVSIFSYVMTALYSTFTKRFAFKFKDKHKSGTL